MLEHLLPVMATLEVVGKVLPEQQQLLDNPYSVLKV